jgi:glycosyltransferase involved in cell wall biosynthesis
MLKNNKKIDVIHAQGLAAAFITKFIARMFRKRSVMSTCAVYNLRPDSLFAKAIKWVLGDFNKILALADVSRRELMSIGVPESKVGVYYLWINQVKYAPRDKQECKKGINLAGRFIVLFVGRFIKIKGVELLVEVAKKIDKGITFVFIGDQGPCFNFIEGAARIYENIKLIKGIRAEQLIPYYQAADIFIIPSLYEEAFGKTIIEALSCGTPVIGSNRGAIPAIITNRVGRVISPSVENIKNEIEYLYRNRAELEKLTRGCRAYAEERFSEKNIEVITNSYY